MGGKSNPSMTNVVLLILFVMTLSHIPILFANSLQGYKEQGFVDWINPKRTYRIINEMGGRESENSLLWRFRITMLDVITNPTKFTCTFEWRQFGRSLACIFCLLMANLDGLYGPNFVTQWIKPIEA
ncbi:hypothetical protein AAG906_022097 [Vitis piasezkii]